MPNHLTASPRTDLPTGIVTFLFTDIEGSTRLLQQLGDGYAEVQDAHAAIMRAAIDAAGGQEIRTEGDSFFAVFASAAGAVAATVAMQRGLHSHPWPHEAGLRVRMGLHSGEARLGGDDYIGLEVNRAARIAAVGHGGQVLVSDATAALVAAQLPDGVRTRPLGSYRLKDLPRPERIHQLEIAGLPAAFPPLRALDVRRAHLPPEATSFIGRGAELDSLGVLLSERRLVTLTGPGGSGKTRLALRTAAAVADRFADGTFFVPLAAVEDAAMVPTVVASTLNLPAEGSRTSAEVVREWIADREVLFVLDNLEQIDGAGSGVDGLLGSAPGLRVLATSRARLHVPGEQEFPVPPFPVPNRTADAASLEASEAVQLFLDRARLVRPGFAPGGEDLAIVGEIVERLDGLPLSIELAAARVRLFPLGAIRDRLGRRLDSLVGGPSTLPPRQRSLRGAIAWSHDLLDEGERALFRRLGAFVGGWTLEAAQDVFGGPPLADVTEALEGLVVQSLVQTMEAEPRFTMLETIREFAVEKLESAGEMPDMHRAHAAYFLGMAEDAKAELVGPGAEAAFARLEADLENLRVAIERSAARGDLATALSIAAALERFWLERNHSAEGRRLLAELVERPDAPEGPELARALASATAIEVWLGDYAVGRRFGERATGLFRRLEDRSGLVNPLTSYGFALIENDPERALAVIEESLDIAHEVGDVHAEATIPLARAIALFRLGRLPEARSSLETAVEQSQRIGDRYFAMMSKYPLARTELLLGDTPAALRDYESALEESRALGLLIGVAVGLDNYAEMAMWSGDLRRAVRLAAAGARMKEEVGGGPPSGMIGGASPLTVGREELPPEEFEAEVQAGRSLDLDSAIVESLATRPPDSPPSFGDRSGAASS
jgi:predicted ATPase/class 3 adenylate cyclase